MKKLIFLPFFILILSLNIHSQVQFQWVRTVSNWTVGIAVNTDNVGNSFVVFTSSGMDAPDHTLILKYTPNGSTIFDIYSDSACYPRAVFIDSSFNEYIIGDYHGGWGANANFTFMKYSPSGNLLWRNIDPNPSGNFSIAIDGDKAGNTSLLRQQGMSGKILSYNPLGILQNSFVITDTLIPVSLKVDNLNNKILLGYTQPGSIVTSVLIKYSPSGSKLWRKDITLPAGSWGPGSGSLRIARGNNIYIMYSANMPTSLLDYTVTKYNSSGTLQWTAYYDNNDSNNIAGNFILDEYENIYVTGGLGTVKFDSSGSQKWAVLTSYLGPMTLDNSHNLYLTGYDFPVFNHGINTMKIDSGGSLAWSIQYPSSGNTYHSVSSIATDNLGNVFLSGVLAYNPITHGNGFVMKYSQLVGIEEISNELPQRFYLAQNYPNPFNPQTIIQLQIPKTAFTELFIYDLTGRKVATMINKVLEHGTYKVSFDGSNLSSGIYFYRILAGSYTDTKKMILLK